MPPTTNDGSTRSTPASSPRRPRCSRRWVARLTPHNAQGEYYLTDVVAMAVADGVPVVAHVATDEASVAGVNDRAQLAALERIVQRRHAQALMIAGTSIADPERIDVRGRLSCGARRAHRRRLRVRGRRAPGRRRQRRPVLRAARRRRRARYAHRGVLAPRFRVDRRATAGSAPTRACVPARSLRRRFTSATSSR